MKKLACNNNKMITRQDLADPYSNMSYHERLVKTKAIDLRNNYTMEDCGNGYIKIKPNDRAKVVK